MSRVILTDRQRAAPPIDRRSLRRGLSAGGYDTTDPRTLAPGLETELARYPGTAFDQEIMWDRGAFMHGPAYSPPGDGWVNWTAAGPVRAELHGRSASYREMSGNSRSRFPTVPTPTGGLHTNPPSGVSRTVPRYVETPQMQAARINRLAPARYAGQTYSQTTQLQGGRR